jgi:hypothetical protein
MLGLDTGCKYFRQQVLQYAQLLKHIRLTMREKRMAAMRRPEERRGRSQNLNVLGVTYQRGVKEWVSSKGIFRGPTWEDAKIPRDSARMEAGPVSVENGPVDLSELICEVEELLQVRAETDYRDVGGRDACCPSRSTYPRRSRPLRRVPATRRCPRTWRGLPEPP